MTASAPLDQAWNYPLFEALYRRRSRRFGLGFEMPEGPFKYKSAHAPVSLSELEEALLLGAGAGFSGLAFWDLPTSTHYPHSQPHPHSQPRVSGRTFPTTRPGGHTTLFWTNDDGFYVLDDKVEPTKLREVETEEERGKLLDVYRAHRRTLGEGRLDIPRRAPTLSGHDHWESNRPGSTLFLPVCDVSAEVISLIAQFVDPALRRYAPASGGFNIVDDRHGNRPAGTERWLKSKFLDAERVMPLSILERQACYYVFSEPAAICQNMFLATEALGLGGWKHCGFLSLEILQSMGFRIAAGGGASPFGNPIGLDGVLTASCPPWYPTMDAAVDAVFSRSPRETGAAVPHRMSDEEHRAGAIRLSAEGLACTKAVCNYIHETYGRFPATTDAMHLMWVMQAHHIDTDYYDRFFGGDAYGPQHAAHMTTWHR
jgi:nitroreductase